MEEALPWNPSTTKCYTFPLRSLLSWVGKNTITGRESRISRCGDLEGRRIREERSDVHEQVVRFGKEEVMGFIFHPTWKNMLSDLGRRSEMKVVVAYILFGFCSNSRPTTNTLNTILQGIRASEMIISFGVTWGNKEYDDKLENLGIRASEMISSFCVAGENEEYDDKLEKLVAEFEEKGIKDLIFSLKETFSPASNSNRNANISMADSLRDPDTKISKTPKRRRTNYKG
ncbi:hypothetical protein H6P81_013142 [Aristolochia fimbriata]|uniref:Uncharacterized protein n=1 Tax=Aristolochia fimbriata TaxID=158543 RepID=A0AAV7EEC3_ARIFI|nr:hypothetical protein H6P81_013142 [Aristolochia fimbriata]